MLLVEIDPEQRLVKAEVFRQLGHFEIAGERSVKDLPAELQDAAEFIGQLCHAQDARVAPIPVVISLDPPPRGLTWAEDF